MSNPDNALLDHALAHRLITRKQHQHVVEELENFPGQDVETLLLRKHFLTPSQLEKLKSLADGEAPPQQARQPQPLATTPAPAAAPPPAAAPETPGAKSSSPPPEKRLDEFDGEVDPGQLKGLAKLLYLARSWGCSDLHVSVGRPPFVRLDGRIRYMEVDALTPQKTEKLVLTGMTEEQRAELYEKQALDFALELPGLGRHRCNVFRQRLGWDGVYRLISNKPPTLEGLGLPPVIANLADYAQGMVLVTGAAGCGKTTTIAALVDLINSTRDEHIITVEDPIEYVIPPARSHVMQREIGRHTLDFAAALRAALRQDPDVIVVGELRDLETISIAISAAETGHLVLGSLHTGSAARTVARILDVYPVKQRDQVRTMLSESLRAVISQQLVPRRDGHGRVAALEVLIVNSGVSALIRDDKAHQMASAMQSGRRQGMRTMDDSLAELAQQGLISGREAYRRAENKAAFEAMKEQD